MVSYGPVWVRMGIWVYGHLGMVEWAGWAVVGVEACVIVVLVVLWWCCPGTRCKRKRKGQKPFEEQNGALHPRVRDGDCDVRAEVWTQNIAKHQLPQSNKRGGNLGRAAFGADRVSEVRRYE